MEEEILILDIETTGFSHSKSMICEIGIVSLDIKTGERKILFDQVVNEDILKDIDLSKAWIVENGFMMAEEILNGIHFSNVKSVIQNIIDSYPLGATAFNNKFDFGFLKHRGIEFVKELQCPMILSTNICKLPGKYKGKYKWPKVEEAYKHFFPESEFVEKHRGADDAFHEAGIVFELIKLGHFKF